MNTLKRLYDETMKREGRTVTIDKENTEKVFFRKNSNSVSEITVRDMFHSATAPIKVGSVVEFNGEMYIIHHQDKTDLDTYKKSTLMRCNSLIKFYINDVLCAFNGIAMSVKTQLDENDLITITSGNQTLILPFNEQTKQIKAGMRYIHSGQAWKVAGHTWVNDNVTLACELDAINDNDDLEYEIADRWEHETPAPVYTLSIQSTPTEINVNDTLQLTVDVTKDGEAVTNEQINYTSSNSSIATVDGNGLITGVAEGSVTISSTLDNDNNINAFVTLTIVENPVVEYSIALDPNLSSMYLNQWQAFSVQLYSGSTQISDSFTISVNSSSTASPSDYTLTDNGDNTFSIYNSNGGGHLILDVVGSLYSTTIDLELSMMF